MIQDHTTGQHIGWQSWSWAGKPNIHRRNRWPFGKEIPLPITQVQLSATPATGWCSWYAFGVNIHASTILAHAQLIAKRMLPLEYILIDDGWTTHGDWLSANTSKFPEGIQPIAERVKKIGMKLGLWIAPFLVSPTSKIFAQHPKWFIRSHDGNLVEGMQITPWDRFLPYHRWILDLQNSQVQRYLKNAITRMVEEWQISYLKLDFLYAQHFNPRFTDAQVPDTLLRTFLSWIKKTYPHIYIAACGSPLIPAIGKVDSMRISADITVPLLSNRWPWNTIFHSRKLKQLQHNLTIRNFTRVLWHIDPDVFVCHPKYGLSKKQVHQLRAIIQKANGTIFLGDDLTSLNPSLWTDEILPLLSPKPLL